MCQCSTMLFPCSGTERHWTATASQYQRLSRSGFKRRLQCEAVESSRKGPVGDWTRWKGHPPESCLFVGIFRWFQSPAFICPRNFCLFSIGAICQFLSLANSHKPIESFRHAGHLQLSTGLSGDTSVHCGGVKFPNMICGFDFWLFLTKIVSCGLILLYVHLWRPGWLCQSHCCVQIRWLSDWLRP